MRTLPARRSIGLGWPICPKRRLRCLLSLRLAICGQLHAQDREASQSELQPEASGEPDYQQDYNVPPRRMRTDGESYNNRQYGNGCCDCDADSPEQRCFDGHRLRGALAGLLPPLPPSMSSATDSWNRYPVSAGSWAAGGSTIMTDW